MTESHLPDDSPPKGPSETVTFHGPMPSVALPERIGRYHVKRAIASGGMGIVYEATQENPRRVVAVKVMMQGITSKSALRRFEYEGQILGRLRHPGIAQIYEAGTHHDPASPGAAVPYFAMEYIPNARPITQFAEEKKLGTRQRMELFAKVCDAIHHGHQKGIIHRDLKPSNILVDSGGQVKIIDFGVARSTDSDLAVTTLQTDVGQLIGTLQYMSPEQCEGDPHDIDTRSDVYALGVVFYQMLCGKLPYDLTGVPMHQATRAIREQHPTKLSTLDKTLRGDVETIALKALEKERERRYQSAADLGHDIQRYLTGEAILARRASIVYQFGLFARRNKAAFAAIAAVFVVLVVGVVVSTTLYLRAEHARLEQSRERERAELERDKAEKFAQFMEQTLKGVGPSVALGRDNTMLKEVMDAAAQRIADGELKDVPEAELRLRMTIGGVYGEIAQYEAAEKMLAPTVGLAEQVLATGQRWHLDDHPEVARGLADLGDALYSVGRWDEALVKYEQALSMRRRLYTADHGDVAQSLHDLAICLSYLKRGPEALPLFEEALDMRKRVYRGDHREQLDSLLALGRCYDWLGRFAEALPKWEEAGAMVQRMHTDDHPDVVHCLSQLSYAYSSLGLFEESISKAEKALAMQLRLLTGDHLGTATIMHNLGLSLDWAGRPAEAVPHLQEALAMRRRLLPELDWSTALLQLNLAYGLASLGRSDEALRNFEESVHMYRATLPAGDWRIHFGEMGLALGMAGMGQYTEAEQLMLPAWEAIVSFKNIPGPYTRRCLLTLTKFYELWDAFDPGKGYDLKAANYRELSESPVPRLEVR